jgi:DNA-binding PadR family transcriptional regulator
MHTPTPRQRGRRPARSDPGRAWFREFLLDFRHGRPTVRRGDVRTAILAVLKDEPMHGYQVIRVLEERSGGHWRPSAGSIYPTLQQLEDEGLVRSEEVDGRRTYRLTDEGHAEAHGCVEKLVDKIARQLGRSKERRKDHHGPPMGEERSPAGDTGGDEPSFDEVLRGELDGVDTKGGTKGDAKGDAKGSTPRDAKGDTPDAKGARKAAKRDPKTRERK